MAAVTRTTRVGTTVADPAAVRPSDLVGRQFYAVAPGLLHVADFAYVPMASLGYTALVIDAYAGLIPGWDCSTSKQGASYDGRSARRRRQGHPLAKGAIRPCDTGPTAPHT